MRKEKQRQKNQKKLLLSLLALIAIVGIAVSAFFALQGNKTSQKTTASSTVQTSSSKATYQLSEEEKAALKEQFEDRKSVV